MTKEEKLIWQREYRKKNGNAWTLKYEKTKKGFLVRKYRNMLSRVNGVQTKKSHLYKGLPIMEKNIFYEWSIKNKDFHSLFNKWEKSGYDRKLCPSINRIDSFKGYILNNVEWITHSENSRQGSLSRRRYSPNYMETYRSRQ